MTIQPGMVRSTLSTEQAQSILKIYWADHYQRRRRGFQRGTKGIIQILAKQFRVSPEVIKKIVAEKGASRTRFPSIRTGNIRQQAKASINRRYGE